MLTNSRNIFMEPRFLLACLLIIIVISTFASPQIFSPITSLEPTCFTKIVDKSSSILGGLSKKIVGIYKIRGWEEEGRFMVLFEDLYGRGKIALYDSGKDREIGTKDDGYRLFFDVDLSLLDIKSLEFWAEKDSSFLDYIYVVYSSKIRSSKGKKRIEIWSCRADSCKYPERLFSHVQGNLEVLAVVPNGNFGRIFLGVRDNPKLMNHILSCSLRKADKDYCLKNLSLFKIEEKNLGGEKMVPLKDAIFYYGSNQSKIFYIPKRRSFSLPPNVLNPEGMRLIGTMAFSYFFYENLNKKKGVYYGFFNILNPNFVHFIELLEPGYVRVNTLFYSFTFGQDYILAPFYLHKDFRRNLIQYIVKPIYKPEEVIGEFVMNGTPYEPVYLGRENWAVFQSGRLFMVGCY